MLNDLVCSTDVSAWSFIESDPDEGFEVTIRLLFLLFVIGKGRGKDGCAARVGGFAFCCRIVGRCWARSESMWYVFRIRIAKINEGPERIGRIGKTAFDTV